MPTETQERKATDKVLNTMYKYIEPGTAEGITWEVSRLTNDLFTTSFVGGGDISIFAASGKRGTITSQLSNAYILDSGGGVPHKFPIQFKVNLNDGRVIGSWNNPVTGTTESVTIKLTFFKKTNSPDGTYYIFYADKSSDAAGYAFTFILL
jgi:hypothetical protein